jgi:hypothetical protein
VLPLSDDAHSNSLTLVDVAAASALDRCVRFVALVFMLGCAARSELGSPQPDGGDETLPCGNQLSCLPTGSYYDCQPPLETAVLRLVCYGDCHDWVLANCPGVGFAY